MGPAPPGAVVVPAALGDSLFERRTLDLVKIDVQGWELEVLAGLSATLARSFGSSLSSGRAPSSSAGATAGGPGAIPCDGLRDAHLGRGACPGP